MDQPRSRRSYPSLHQVSLTPLTSRFPIDDDDDDNAIDTTNDYFSPRDDRPNRATSYLSSYSVPGSPGVLSHSNSRSGSRARHHHHRHQSKSSSRRNLSDPDLLNGQDTSAPLHHQHSHKDKKRTKSSTSHQQPFSDAATGRRDTEWLLRAGIALASSTREEKGQSWLAKRESSTSLVADGGGNNGNGTFFDIDAPAVGGAPGTTSKQRRSRSGRSTPAAYSRRGSRSRRNSRPDLAMTTAMPPGLEMTTARPRSSGFGDKERDRESTSAIEEPGHFVPDFVDERIRAEMASLQRDENAEEEEGYSSSSEESTFDSEDEIDEQELQRLTRERGFGLGSWFDRMVEWTVFGVDDTPADTLPRSVEDVAGLAASETLDNSANDEDEEDDAAHDVASIHSESEKPVVLEKPQENGGGWEDAGWLLRTMKRAFL